MDDKYKHAIRVFMNSKTTIEEKRQIAAWLKREFGYSLPLPVTEPVPASGTQFNKCLNMAAATREAARKYSAIYKKQYEMMTQCRVSRDKNGNFCYINVHTNMLIDPTVYAELYYTAINKQKGHLI